MSTQNVVMVSPEAVAPQVRAMLQMAANTYELGEGVKISKSGKGKPTHRGYCMGLKPEQIAVATGQVIPEIEGVTKEEIQSVLGYLTVEIEGVKGAEEDALHLKNRALMDYVLSNLGLQIIQEDTPT